MKLLQRGALVLVLLQLCFISQAQTVTQQLTDEEVANRLNYVYGNDFILQNQELITAYGQVMNNRIEYVVTPHTTDEKFPLLSTVPLLTKLNPMVQGANFAAFNVDEFNPLVYNMEYFSDRTLVYRIDNTDYLMVVKSIRTN